MAETERFRFDSQLIVADLDIARLTGERQRNTTFASGSPAHDYRVVGFHLNADHVSSLKRAVARTPFVPPDDRERSARCHEIFQIQTCGLMKRLRHTTTRHVVIGLSGGLDSTLALLVTVKAFDRLGLDRKGIVALTMPGFGTTARTRSNAEELAEQLGVTLRVVSIDKAVRQHFRDIGHNPSSHDVTYENSQARERTQILMDVANQVGGLVIGTGDLSELALGWCTYNGDHMSMYAVNSGVPKTLVRYLVDWCAREEFSGRTSAVLNDVCATPVSPELLPPDADGNIEQLTEEVVGPYELHDFFLYQVVRMHYPPLKVLLLAEQAFAGDYPREVLVRWLKQFYRRFFSQQFKRSCLPDGPKVGTVALSPRGTGVCRVTPLLPCGWPNWRVFKVTGTLYVVATPIGNLEDMTYRSVRILQDVALVAAEDTRHSRKLLDHYGIRTPMISYHEHNEEARAEQLVAKLLAGESLALISDAGTPCIADPGYRLVSRCRQQDIDVVAIRVLQL